MSKNGKKNGSGNGRGSEMGRDSKGRFAPGNPGGTGRGNIREAIESIKELLLDDDVSLTSSKVLDPVGRVLLHGTTSKDMKTRVDSSKLFFTWLGKRTDAEEREKNDSGVSSEDLNSFASLLSIKQELDVMEAEGITDLLCFECKQKLGIIMTRLKND